MLEKLDERFDKAKYSSMIKKILQEEFCLDFLFEKTHNKDENLIRCLMSIFTSYLKFNTRNRLFNQNTNKSMENGLENSFY